MEGDIVNAQNEFDYNQTDVIKCHNCGADMLYDPQSAKLTCPYCHSSREVHKRVPSVRDYFAELQSGAVVADKDSYLCPNCGGKMELSAFETAKQCPFCGATNIVALEDIKGMRPDSILPFGVSKEGALAIGKKWIKRKLYAPHKLKKNFVSDKFRGMYIPSFVFYANSHSQYKGVLGERRTRVVGSGKNRHTETYIYWYSVSGYHDMPFGDVVIEASTQITQSELSNILPYDMHNAEAYTKEYISGFGAERYDTPINVSFDCAKRQMDEAIRKSVIARYNADVVQSLNIDTTYSQIKFRYTLLPLWICGYTYKKKVYHYLVNGRTGKAAGKTPISPLKVSLTVLFALAIVAVVVYFMLFY